MNIKITRILFSVLLLLSITKIHAQSSVSGTVTDTNNSPLPGVNIIIKNTIKGTTTDFDGKFELKNVKNTDVLEISMMGLKTQDIPVGDKRDFKIVLQEDSEALDEVVVTGVAVGTSVKKLPFALSKVNEEQLKEVPAVDLGNALRGKVAGVRIVQANGDPNTPASIRLRGSNSIMGSQEPLIIIDGVITGSDTNLRDINMEDVESIEVIKGAAASSLYGSLSGNGVIQIITKRGKNTNGVPKLTVRNETGFSQIVSEYPLAKTHRWKLRDPDIYPWDVNDANVQGRWFLDDDGNRVLDDDNLLDNPFPRLLDNQDKVYTPQLVNTMYASLSSGNEHFKYHLSFQNSRQGGAIEGVKPNVRNNGRINIDYKASKKLAVKTSFSYADTEGHNAPGSTRSSTLYFEPWIDISEKDEKGFVPTPAGSQYLQRYRDNPLYEVGILESYFDRQRLMFSPSITYDFNDNLHAGLSYSMDDSRSENYSFRPKEYEDPDPEEDDDGRYSITKSLSQTAIAQMHLSFNKKIGNFDTRLTAKFLREDRRMHKFYARGSQLKVVGIRTLNITDPDTRQTESRQEEEKTSNFFFDANVIYKDKIIINGLIRRDGSSLFGENSRWQTFGRASLAYIVTEDVEIKNVENLKLRFSWGVSGQRPTYNAQYETYNIDRYGRLQKSLLGNRFLLPARVSEWELGFNARFFNNIDLEINYAETTVTNDFIKVPLPTVAGGFTQQWQNIGGIGSSSFEIQVGADIIRKKDFNWNLNVSWDKVTQEIEDLGGVPPFNRSRSLFRVQEGLPYAVMYGYKTLTDINQLTLDSNGFVLNYLGSANGDVRGTLKPGDFEVNEHGYVIVKGTKGTDKEQTIFLADELGQDKKVVLGDTNPDWNLGISSNVSWKNFNLYFVIDHKHGGEVYNSAKQGLYRAERHGDQELFARQGKSILYSNNASNLDRGYSNTSHFVEDGTYTKLREVSLGYTLNEKSLGKLGKHVKGLKLSIIGRNLYTITNYSGFDPEVAYSRGARGARAQRNVPNPTNDAIDRRAYPQFRVFTGMIQLTF